MPTDSRGKGRIFDEIKSRGKEERKAAKLWGFAAWYVRDGVGFNESLVPDLGFSAKLMGEYLSDLPILRGNK